MDRIEARRLAGITWPYVALWSVLTVGVAALALYVLDTSRTAAVEAGRAEAGNLARVMAENVDQVLSGIDRTLTVAKVMHEERLTSEPLKRMAQVMQPLQGTDAERRVNHFDAGGRFVASSDAELRLPGAVSIADRRYFIEARTRNDLPLYIGEPMFGRVSHAIIIPIAKRLQAADGSFDGVVVTALDPHRLVHVFRRLRVGERSSVGIAHRDGPVLAFDRVPLPSGAPEVDVPAPTTIGEVVQQGQLVDIAAIAGTELVAFASIPESVLMQSHRRYMHGIVAFALVTIVALSLPIVLVGGRAYNEVHRRRQLELKYRQAEARARIDPLTGLANRTSFDEARRAAHDALRREGVPYALAFIDIDHFKRLNDALGHSIGDEALRCVAETLTSGVRHTDAVGRLGGDEFAVLMPGVTAATMHRRFDPIKIDLDAMVARRGWSIGFSVGVVAYETAPPNARDAVSLADRMMYDAKASGRDAVRYAVYREGSLRLEDDESAAAVA
jgi:diguanylate cyclase (GGDEF)-like protein